MSGATPLYSAAIGGNDEMIQLLIAKGAEVDPQAMTTYGRTLLHAAAFGDAKNFADQLIAKGADVNAKDGDGRSPLSLAVMNGHKGMADLLRKHGAKE